MSSKSIFICAGEVSGDVHGAAVLCHLKSQKPDYTFFGVGGDKLAEGGMELLYHVNQMSIIGITEVIRSLPFIWRALNRIEDELKHRNPELIILIDYPGFNIRIGRIAKKLNIKVFYYISPQVWAWGKQRLKNIVEITDRMALILPFEEEIYRSAGLNATFVGHPLLDCVHSSMSKEEFLEETGCTSRRPLIGILPGSRAREIKKLLPAIADSIKVMRRLEPDIVGLIGAAPSVSRSIYDEILTPEVSIPILYNRTYEIMQYSDILFVASGTATLEAAILGTPMLILYKVSMLTYLLCRYFIVKIPYIGLVNIIAGKEVVPELIQGKVRPDIIAEAAGCILHNIDENKKIRKDLKIVKEKLGTPGAAERTANLIADML